VSELNPKQRLEQLQRELQEKTASLEAGYNEVAKLTDQLQKDQAEVDDLQQNVRALQQEVAASAPESEAKPEPIVLTSEELDKNSKHIELIANSDLFDAEWYLETYPDVKQSEKFSQQPASHYTLFGGFEGRKPCPEFDSAYYLQQYPDVGQARINPLAHYLLFGRDEGRLLAPPADDE